MNASPSFPRACCKRSEIRKLQDSRKNPGRDKSACSGRNGVPGGINLSQELELRLRIGQQLLDLLFLGAQRQQLLSHHLHVTRREIRSTSSRASRAPHFEGGSFGIIWSVSVPRKPRGEEQAKKVDRLHRGSVERCCTYTPERATHGLWLLERRRLITQALTEGATKPSISRAQQQQQQRAVGTLVTARCARP